MATTSSSTTGPNVGETNAPPPTSAEPTPSTPGNPPAGTALEIDSDSGFEENSNASSYTASLLTEVRNYKYENGRRYHSYREGQYVLPNDEPEQDRQDLAHHIRTLLLNGDIFRAPIGSNPKRVLDIGTGTGIWAIDFADEFPSADVIGTDLSPIQPSWVPPNLRFLVDDAESTWLFNRNQLFDFIHVRDLAGSIADWPKLLQQAYDHLEPGGWIEVVDYEIALNSDDDTMKLAPNATEYLVRLCEASEVFKKPIEVAKLHEPRLIAAGFEEVKDEVFKVPQSDWSKDPKEKALGRFSQWASLMAVEAYALALFTRVLGWTNEKTQVFLAAVRKELKDPNLHMYGKLHVVYGRKPKAETA